MSSRGGARNMKATEFYKSGRMAEVSKIGRERGNATQSARRLERIREYEENPKRCEYCQAPIPYNKKRENRYCGHECAALNQNPQKKTQEQRAKISMALIGLQRGMPEMSKTCAFCGREFIVAYGKRKQRLCSASCAKALQRGKKRPGISGGAREGSGRSISGWHRGIYCGSTWELAYLVYCLDHDIDIKRCRDVFSYGGGRKYSPDFVVDGTIIEIKGYVLSESVLASKVASVEAAGRKIIVLRKAEMEPYLAYARDKFGRQSEKWFSRALDA